MTKFIAENIAERIVLIEVGAESNPASPLNIKAFELGEQQPILVQEDIDGSYRININQDYYDKNKEVAELLIKEILETTKKEMICFVSIEMIIDSFIETIKANDNIKSVAFWGITRIAKNFIK